MALESEAAHRVNIYILIVLKSKAATPLNRFEKTSFLLNYFVYFGNGGRAHAYRSQGCGSDPSHSQLSL